MNQQRDTQRDRQEFEIDEKVLQAVLVDRLTVMGEELPEDGPLLLEHFDIESPLVAAMACWNGLFYEPDVAAIREPEDVRAADICLYPVLWEDSASVLVTLRDSVLPVQLSTFCLDPWPLSTEAADVVADIVATANEQLPYLRVLMAVKACTS